MRDRKRYLTWVLIVSALVGLLALPGYMMYPKGEDPIKERKVEESYQVKGLKIPEQMSFANEKVPLNRIDIRERLDRELLSNTYFHSNTLLLLKRANRYFPVIDTILRSEGIPEDFKYLALIESSLDQRAKSPAGAVGLWQFLKSTGKEYGLEVNAEVDERYHVEKSTRAACAYFRKAYEKFGSWTLVASSYNIGQRRIADELQRQKVDNYYDLLLVEETSRYVFRILAIKEIFKCPIKFGFHLEREDLYPVIHTHTIKIHNGVKDFGVFANEHHISYGILKQFNPWLRDSFLTMRGQKVYELEIPEKSDLQFNKRKVEVYQQNWIK